MGDEGDTHDLGVFAHVMMSTGMEITGKDPPKRIHQTEDRENSINS